MGHLETDCNLPRIPAEYLLAADDDESGGIGAGVVHLPLQHLQPIDRARMLAGNGRLGLVPVIRHLFGRESIILHANLPPVLDA